MNWTCWGEHLVIFLILYALLSCGGYHEASQTMDIQVLVKLLNEKNWRRIQLITTKDSKSLFRQLSSTLLMSAIYQQGFNNNDSLVSCQLSKLPRFTESKMVVWSPVHCQRHIITWAHKNSFLLKRYSWLFVQDDVTDKGRLLNTRDVSVLLRPDSNVHILSPTSLSQESKYQVCRLLHDGPKNVKCLLAAVFRQNQWYYRQIDNQFPLTGFILRVGAAHMPPLSVRSGVGNVTTFGGTYIDLSERLAKYLGFGWHYVIDETRSYGVLENGNWTGAMGMLQRKEIDFSSMLLIITKERAAYIDFSAFMWQISNVALIRKPTAISNKINLMTYTQPFPGIVWMSSFLMCGLSFICFLIIFNLHQQIRSTDFQLRCKDAGIIFWSTIYLSIQTSVNILPKNRSTQLTFLSFSLFLVILSRSYGTFLTASLTVKKANTVYETMAELLDDGVYGISILKSSSNTVRLKNAKGGTLSRIWMKLLENPTNLVDSDEDGFKKVINEKYVYLMPLVTARLLCRDNCTFTYINDHLLYDTIHYAIQKNSPYYEFITSKLMMMRSAGLLGKVFSTSIDKCADKTGSESIGIHQAFGCFVLLGCGHIAAFSVFCLEWYIHTSKI